MSGLIATNPCEGGGRLYTADRTDKLWRDEDVAAFLGSASRELTLALMLALWSGQRQGDLLRLAWSLDNKLMAKDQGLSQQ